MVKAVWSILSISSEYLFIQDGGRETMMGGEKIMASGSRRFYTSMPTYFPYGCSRSKKQQCLSLYPSLTPPSQLSSYLTSPLSSITVYSQRYVRFTIFTPLRVSYSFVDASLLLFCFCPLFYLIQFSLSISAIEVFIVFASLSLSPRILRVYIPLRPQMARRISFWR